MGVTVYPVIGIFIIWICNAASTIPSDIHVCHRSDPEVSKCILDAIDVIRPKLRNGIPELNIPPLEPFTLNRHRAVDGALFQLELTDVDFYGASYFEIHNLELDLPNHICKMQIRVPMLLLFGSYDVDLQLAVPIKGTGTFEANATNYHGSGILKGEIIEKKGIRNMKFTNLTLDLHMDDFSIKVNGFGDTLSETVHQLIKQFKLEIIRLSTPVINEEVSKIILDILNKPTERYSYDELFPE